MRLFALIVTALALLLPASAGAQKPGDDFRIVLNARGPDTRVHYATVYSAREVGTGLATGRRLTPAGQEPGLSAWSFRVQEKWQIAFTAEISGLSFRANRALRKLAVPREGYLLLIEQPDLRIAITEKGCEFSIGEPGVQRIMDEDLGINITEPGVHVTIGPGGAQFSIGEPGVQ